jgi:hypothetical protein
MAFGQLLFASKIVLKIEVTALVLAVTGRIVAVILDVDP